MAQPVVIVNPNAGGGKTRRAWPQIEAQIKEALGSFRPLFTERAGHASELARGALREGADLVIALGGDGTINEVVNGFFDGTTAVRPGAAFAVLPSGTGGDFVKTTGSPRALADAARAIAGGKPRAMDAGRLTFTSHDGKRAVRHFINITTFGMGGLVDKYVNRSSKALGGKASFMIASLRAAIAYDNPRCRVRLDGGEALEQPVYVCAVANGRFCGGGMKMAPDAVTDDGQFDVVQIGGISFPKAMRHFSSLYSGAHVHLPFVRVARARRVDAEPVDAGVEVLLDVDGEQPGRLPASFEILPGAIQIVA